MSTLLIRKYSRPVLQAIVLRAPASRERVNLINIFSRMWDFLRSIIEIGVRSDMGPSEAKYVRIINIWVLAPVFLTPYYLFFALYFKAPLTFIMLATVTSFTMPVLYLNYRGWMKFSRAYYITIWNIYYCVVSVTLGPETLTHYFIFTSIGVAIVITPKGEGLQLFLLIVQSLIAYNIARYLHHYIPPRYAFTPGEMKFITLSMEYGVLAIIIFFAMAARVGAIFAEDENDLRFSSMAELLPEAVCEIDEKGRFVYMNAICRARFGVERGAEKGYALQDMVVAEEGERLSELLARAMNGDGSESDEFTGIGPGGGKFPMALYCKSRVLLRKKAGVRAIIIDLTERKRLETELLNAKRLESVGLLAGGLAHDFNNILVSVAGNLQLAILGTEPDEEISEYLEVAEKGCFRARELTQRFLTFSRGGAPLKKPASVEAIVREAAGICLHGSDLEFHFSAPDDLWSIEVDSGQIGQVISNVLRNAEQAMPEGGKIIVSAQNVAIENSEPGGLEAGNYVQVSITDEGHGMDNDVLANLFDPYFTTKEEGHGLGLAIAFRIVRNHGGNITVESAPRRGATFHVFLGATETEPEEEAAEDPDFIAGSGRILVMDDDPEARETAVKILEKTGYQVVTAKDGERAVNLYKEYMEKGKKFDVALIDLVVPNGMGGVATIKALKKIDPQVKAVIVSAYSEDAAIGNFEKLGFMDAVVKPYKIKEISAVIHEAMKTRQ